MIETRILQSSLDDLQTGSLLIQTGNDRNQNCVAQLTQFAVHSLLR